jgi:hypothetical protein
MPKPKTTREVYATKELGPEAKLIKKDPSIARDSIAIIILDRLPFFLSYKNP